MWLISTSTARRGPPEPLGDEPRAQRGEPGERGHPSAGRHPADAATTARLDLPAQAIDTDDSKNVEWYADEMVRTKSKYAAIVVANKNKEIVALEHRRPRWATAACDASRQKPRA